MDKKKNFGEFALEVFDQVATCSLLGSLIFASALIVKSMVDEALN